MKLIIVIIICTFSSYTKAAENLTPELAEKYALYAMMSSNAYHDKNRTYFPIEKLGWQRVDRKGRPTDKNSYSPKWLGKIFSNLQYDIWENKNSNTTVIAFKGTDEKIDWFTGNLGAGISIQYKSAKKHVRKYIKKHRKRTIILTGHSLGGGLAISVSLWLPNKLKAVVFNPSPRLYDGFGDHNQVGERIAIYQNGDILNKLSNIYPKFYNLVQLKDKTRNIDVIKTNFTYDESQSKHQADLLAEGILRCATNNPDYVKLANELTTTKIECNF